MRIEKVAGGSYDNCSVCMWYVVQVENGLRLVEGLQEDLASSKGRCDGLQQVVSPERETQLNVYV